MDVVKTAKILVMGALCFVFAGCTSGPGLTSLGMPTAECPIVPEPGKTESVKTFKLASVTTVPAAETCALFYAGYYAQGSGNMENARQLFEVPAIGTVIAGAYQALYSSGGNAIAATALAGASLLTFENYYAPRQRAAIYSDGFDAMACIAGLAKTRAVSSSASTATGLAALASFSDNKAILLADANDYESAGSLLRDAIIMINKRIQRRVGATSTSPNLSELASEIKKAQTAALASAEAKQNAKFAIQKNAMDTLSPMQNLALSSRAAADTNVTVPNLSSSITDCTAKAGS